MKDRHKEFADTYLANGYNARKAYMACYPDCKPNSADVLAYRLLNREDVKEYIDTQRKLMFESRRVDMYRWVEEIANIAISQKTGARGLRAIVEKILMDFMFEVPSIKGKKKLEVTKEIVTQEKSIDVEKLLA